MSLSIKSICNGVITISVTVVKVTRNGMKRVPDSVSSVPMFLNKHNCPWFILMGFDIASLWVDKNGGYNI